MDSQSILSHFSIFAFNSSFWALSDKEQMDVARSWRAALPTMADSVHLYRTGGTRTSGDVLVWSSLPTADTQAPARFFERFLEVQRPYRSYVRVVDVLWGFTRPSQYARGSADREIDPMTKRSLPYLIVYPFVKTHEWYQHSVEERRRMMTGHIRIGKQHEGIDQLLLYSTGLQDQEFVVAYESADLSAFSALVVDLRMTEARLYTERDTPVYVGIHVSPDDQGMSWL